MRQLFDDYIGKTPPSRIDIDEIERRSHQVLRRRRAVVACVAGLAVLGTAALTVATVNLGLDRTTPVTPTPTPTLTTTPTPSMSEPDRLLAVLKAAIAREAPQVTGAETLTRQMLQCDHGIQKYVPEGPGVKSIPCPLPSGPPPGQPPASSAPLDLSRNYVWQGLLTSPTGTYHVRIFINPSLHYDPDAPPVNEGDARERAAARAQGEGPRRGPNGEHILLSSFRLYMTKPDGTGIMIMAWDTQEKGAFMTRSPFTADQITAIGLDPELHLG